MDDRLAVHLELEALDDEEFVRRAYRLVLRRDPEPEALRLRTSRAGLLAELVASPEFATVRALDDALARAGDGRFLEAPPDRDERAIEIPWVLTRARGARRLLDLGTANAPPTYVAGLLGLGAEDIVAVDLADASIPGVRTVVADVRELPFTDRSFDAVLCVSTLEHVGRDNRVYGAGEERDEQGMAAALGELRRVLDREGRLLVTVPCGEREDHAWFVQLDPDAWNALFVGAGFRVDEEEIYARSDDGWRAAPHFDPSGVRYGESAAAVLCAALSPVTGARRLARRARAAAARSAGA